MSENAFQSVKCQVSNYGFSMHDFRDAYGVYRISWILCLEEVQMRRSFMKTIIACRPGST